MKSQNIALLSFILLQGCSEPVRQKQIDAKGPSVSDVKGATSSGLSPNNSGPAKASPEAQGGSDAAEMDPAKVIDLREASEPLESAGEGAFLSGAATASKWTTTVHSYAGLPKDREVSVVSWSENTLHVFWRGDNCQLMLAWRVNGVWGGTANLGGCIESVPSAVSQRENQINVFARGSGNNNLWHIHWNGSAWSGWENLGGVIKGSPSAVSSHPGHLDVYVRGMDDGLHHKYFSGGWSGWESLGGKITDSPSAVSPRQGFVNVFVRGYDGGLWQRYFNGGWHGWQRLGNFAIKGSPAATSKAPGLIDVFARTSSGRLGRTSWNGSAWSPFYGYDFNPAGEPAAVSYNTRNASTFFPSGGRLIERKLTDHSPLANDGHIVGHVDAVVLEADGSNTISGWACQTGYSATIPVHLYAVNPANGVPTGVGGVQAHDVSEEGVANMCHTRHKNHRFTLKVPAATVNALAGQLVRVYGIVVSPRPGASNIPLSRSDYLVFRSAKFSRLPSKPALALHNTVFSVRPNEVVDDIDAMASMGVKLTRMEMAPGNRELLVKAMRQANAHQMDVLVVLNLLHHNFYDTPAPGTFGINKLSAISIPKYAASLRDDLNYLKSQGVTPAALEVGNEIDLSHFNGDIPDHDFQHIPGCERCVVVKEGALKLHDSNNAHFNNMIKVYGQVLKESHKIAQEIFPNMKIITFGTASKPALPHIFFRLGGALGENYLNYADAIGVHDYGYDNAEFAGKLQSINGTLQHHFKFTKKIWVTEFGWGGNWWIPGTNGQTIPPNSHQRKNWFKNRIDFYGTTGQVEAMFIHDFRPTTDHNEKYSIADRVNGNYVMYKETEVFRERGP